MRRVNIVQGEHAVSGDGDVMLTTLLGSCVAVCLFDGRLKRGGMNHFLLGQPGESEAQRDDTLQRYGSHAMEVLINGLLRSGSDRKDLRAQIYGGAKMIAVSNNIGEQNAQFAQRFLRAEGIPVGVFDVGGTNARRVEFLPAAGKARALKVRDEVAVPRQTPQPVASNDVELF